MKNERSERSATARGDEVDLDNISVVVNVVCLKHQRPAKVSLFRFHIQCFVIEGAADTWQWRPESDLWSNMGCAWARRVF